MDVASGAPLLASRIASALRLGSGGRVGALGPRPRRMLELYEFEGCPFCRKVREALSILDLDALVHPCPKGGTRFRPVVARRGGRTQFPWLVDADAGVALYESDAIVRHLFERYGDGRVPPALRQGPLTDLSAMAVGLLRPGRGSFHRESKPPERALELFGFEASPATRLVRERLSVLELPHVSRSRAPGSPRPLPAGVARAELPHLVDPGRGERRSGAPAILAYLEHVYAVRRGADA